MLTILIPLFLLIVRASVKGDPEFLEQLSRFRKGLLANGKSLEHDLQKAISAKDDSRYFTDDLKTEWLPIECKVLNKNFETKQVIHTGKRNTVKRVVDQRGHSYAYKTFDNSDEYTAELQFFMFAKNDFIVKPICTMRSGSKAGIVMEYVDGMSSEEYAKTADEDDIIRISAQLLTALEYIHWLGFVHADMKPQNVMIDERGNVKVIDFGFAIALPYYKMSRGTPTTIAPELVKLVKGKIHEGIDWWAYGSTVAIWYGVYLKMDSSTRKYVPLRVFHGSDIKFGSIPKKFPTAVRQLLYICMDPNPENRRFNTLPQLQFLKNLPLFESIDWE